VPRGAAPLAAVAGLCAIGMIAALPRRRLAALRVPAVILGLLLVWAALSATWALEPWRALLKDAQLAALFAAGLALAAAADRLAMPRRLTACLLAGTGFAIAVVGVELATGGGLSQFLTVRHFALPRLNQIAVWNAMLVLPLVAMLACRGRVFAGALAAGAVIGTMFHLEADAAKVALALSLPVAALLYLRQRLVARVAAALSVAAILTAPLTLPRLDDIPGMMATADAVKSSAGHRLLIWSFIGDHIAERPLLGWGLDAARAIPGGKEEIRPGQNRLPLHPHNAALQLWVELGLPGALLFALLLGWLWLRIAEAPWPTLYAAAAGGSLATATAVAFAGWGIWQEWWVGTLAMTAFAILTMARTATADPLSALQGGEGGAQRGALGGWGVGRRSGIRHLTPTLSAPKGGEGARGDYSAAAVARVARLRSLMSRRRLRSRIALGVTSTSSSSSI
jgi:O-antigen ligase